MTEGAIVSNNNIIDIRTDDRFKLTDSYIEKYQHIEPPWGPLGLITYKRTYSRIKDNGNYEEWFETIRRVVEGIYTYQKWHCRRFNLPWNGNKAQHSAQKMYDLIFNMKFLPPGRGLWTAGTAVVEKLGATCLNNCAFTSTEDINHDFAEPFCFLMDASMLGVGVGGNTEGAGKITIRKPRIDLGSTHVVADTREGWVDLVRIVLNSYAARGSLPEHIDYSLVRPEGVPIKTFGGVASGPGPLIELIAGIKTTLDPLVDKSITSQAIADLFNRIGKCVVSGNVRRSAIIMLGEGTDQEFLELKDPELHPAELTDFRWTSNNSIYASVGMNYTDAASRTARNGEPGYAWMQNAREYGRMGDAPDYGDMRAKGFNPCQIASATVLTPDGIRTFSDITRGSIIWSGERWTTVTAKWSTGVKPTFKFHTRAGSFYGTDNHRVIQRGERIEVKDADTIDTAKGPLLDTQPLDPQDIMNGLVFGDGYYEHKSTKVVLTIGEDDQDYHQSEIKHLIRLPVFPSQPDDFCVESMFQCIPHTYERKVPELYYKGNNTQVRGFLRGLYTANGSIIKIGNSGRVTLKASSFYVIEHVQTMLSSLGIRSYYTTNKAHDVNFSNGTYTCKESYDLNITTDRLIFQDQIGFIQKDKQLRLNEICNPTSKYANNRVKSTYEIVSIEELGVQEVFDLTVDAVEHTYWTGGLLVSNCSEQVLENFELCTLVESFPARHNTFDEYKQTLKYAYLYAKTITLLPTHNQRTNAVMMRNRRIGCSQSGIIDARAKLGRREHLRWCDLGYKELERLDTSYSEWLCVPLSRRKTSVKPSGSVSLLNGSSPGIHYPHAEYYFRTIRIAANSPLIPPLQAAGYYMEPMLGEDQLRTYVVYFPIHEQHFDRSKDDVTIWEQVQNAADMQRYWADNAVSITVTFKPEEASQIKYVLEAYEDKLKAISFLPLLDHAYPQAPYQTISKEEYEEAVAKLKPLNLNQSIHEVTEKYCDGASCTF